YNPKGEAIFSKTLTSSEFGTINGDFDLPEGAPLGEYSIQAIVPQTNANVAASGSNRFRVEEYKRPEFQVTVDAPDLAVRPGETVAAKINARYYFGSPVPNATVKYTVRRSTWWASYKFPTPYDWLWAYWGTGDYDTGRRNIGGEGAGTIVKEGTVRTDAEGNAEVNFAATEDKTIDNVNDWWRRYQNPLYTIEAIVTDASRRTIEGQGEVRLAKQQYFAFLNTKGGFFQQGDRVPIEIRIQDANDKPQAANGKMVVYKQLPGDKEDRVLEAPVSIDRSGTEFWTWNNDQSGQFRIAYEATDAWGNKVETSTIVWVAGPELNTTQFRLQGVTIVLDKRSYEEGEALRALVVADQPDTTVLWTQEAGGDILKRQLVHIQGKSEVIEIPIEHRHVPNFSLAAALVKNFEVYQAQEEVFVPPVQQLINVSVTGDKETYKPGESGTFQVKATDWKGRPARAEVSLALIDASLFYIQKNYAPDVRTFYYGQRRANSVNLDSSRSGQVQSRTEDDNLYGKYEQHGWQLPDGLGQLNLDPAGWGWYGYYDYDGGFGGGRGSFALESRSRGLNGRLSMEMAAAPMSMAGASDSAAVGGAMPMSGPAFKAANRLSDSESSTGLAPAQTRSNFAETAYWAPAVVTNGGAATVKVTFPDSLTQWHATARGLTEKTQVGSGENDVETKKDLLVRLQSPRFFTQRDQVVLSANVHNYLKTDKRVKVALDLGDGLKMNGGAATKNVALLPTSAMMDTPSGFITVKAGEETRINWLVNVTQDGTSKIKMTAQSDEESDAVEMSFPVMVHGVQRFANQSGILKDGNKTVVNINIPKERRFGASTLNVQLNPSLAATMLDALPYLADFPYGCVEQTMSRFLPSVVVAKVLSDSGVNLPTLRQRAKAYEAEAKAQ
ncbi:MAG TPA: alpha-2-macroglobulin family protein, partial [Abditibacteriaceae bacterium]|nr:alpha-2-macroglobulin family protein [Abditibacteriaceae bacterium]